jgi:hypothetical protein
VTRQEVKGITRIAVFSDGYKSRYQLNVVPASTTGYVRAVTAPRVC